MPEVTRKLFFLFLFFVLVSSATWYGLVAYSASFSIQPWLQKDHAISPNDTIVVHFEKSVVIKNYQENIKIVPNTQAYIRWEDNYSTMRIKPKEAWDFDAQYTLSLPEGRTTSRAFIDPIELTFSTIQAPSISDVHPKNGSDQVLIDIEEPIAVSFKESVKDFDITFQLEPPVELAHEYNEEKTVLKALPTQPLKPGTTYTLVTLAKYKNNPDAQFAPLHTTTFTTALPAEPESWSENIHERANQAKLYAQPKIFEGKYIDINISTQIMTIFENGQSIGAFPISSGKKGMDTPKGTFKVHNKHDRPWSKRYGLYMPNWMAITPDGLYGIHELPEWPSGYKEGANHLGIPVSHGCVRLGVGSSRQVYEWAEVGTPVIIY